MAFVIDTTGENKDFGDTINSTENDRSTISKVLQEYKDSLREGESNSDNPNVKNKNKKESTSTSIGHLFEELGWESTQKGTNLQKGLISDNMCIIPKIDINGVLSNSVITPDFEKLHSVPAIEVSERQEKLQRKKINAMTKGSKWYGLPATEITEEIKQDLEILKMRSVLDPKRFYKKNDLKVLPKYFQIGKVLDSPLDYYNNRLVKKQRKRTLVDELLSDAEFNKYNKKKYKEIIEEKQQTHYKAWRKAKKLKKK